MDGPRGALDLIGIPHVDAPLLVQLPHHPEKILAGHPRNEDVSRLAQKMTTIAHPTSLPVVLLAPVAGIDNHRPVHPVPDPLEQKHQVRRHNHLTAPAGELRT